MTLTATETKRLSTLETTIADDLQRFVRVGQALREIRDGRLYRAKFASFEDYVHARWGFERQHAYRLITATQVHENVAPVMEEVGLPATERHFREIARAPAELQPEVIRVTAQRARAEGRSPTSQDYADVVAELHAPEDLPPPPQLNKGQLAMLNSAVVSNIVNQVSKTLQLVRKVPPAPGTQHIREARSRLVADLERLEEEIAGMVPKALCDRCGGKGCKSCRKRGFV